MNATLAFLNGAGDGRHGPPDSVHHDDHVSMMHLLLAVHPLRGARAAGNSLGAVRRTEPLPAALARRRTHPRGNEHRK